MSELTLSGLRLGEGLQCRLADSGRLSHAYIITGSSEEDRHQLARWLTGVWLCGGEGEKPCSSCMGCRKIVGGIHPDITWLSPPEGKREISVEQIRQMRSDAYIRPNEGKRKVYVIDRAHAMNHNAQNALLKLLEDGPVYAAFLLISENPQELLPTVRSRCETVSLLGEQEQPVCAQAVSEAAACFSRLILSDDRRGLAEYAAALEREKWDNDGLIALLDGIIMAIHPRLAKNTAGLLPWMDHLKTLREAARFYINAGHLLGWLAVGPKT